MLYLKSCPKCITGAVKFNSEWGGNRLACLNCGYALLQPPVVQFENPELTEANSGKPDKDGVAA